MSLLLKLESGGCEAKAAADASCVTATAEPAAEPAAEAAEAAETVEAAVARERRLQSESCG